MSVANAQTMTRGESTSRWPKDWLWFTAAVVVGLLAYGPLLWMFFRQQWEKPHYQFFPFVIAAFAWLLWQRYAEGVPRGGSASRHRWAEYFLLFASFGLLLASIVVRSPWGAMASCILLAGYACLRLSSIRTIENIWGIWLLLWLMMPLPFGLDHKLITTLQRVSSKISSFVLDAVGVDHLMEGNTLALPSKQLFVDEACSGIISILSVVACAAIYAVVKNRTPLHLALLAAIGVGWATVINVARISIIAFVFDRWGIDWSTGAPHEILSLVLFLITFLALLSSDVILSVLLDPVAAKWHDEHAADLRFGYWLARAWDGVVSWGKPALSAVAESVPPPEAAASAHIPLSRRTFGWSPVFVFLPLAILQGALFAYAMKVAPERIPAMQLASALSEEDLPSSIGDLIRKGFEAQKNKPDDIHGMYSRLYKFVAPDGLSYVTSFDFPLSGGWHELTECYAANGWERTERAVHQAPEAAGDWEYVEADFEKPGEAHGMVLFTEFDQYGDPLQPNEGWVRPADSFLYKRNLYLESRKTFQVQVFVTSQTKLTEAQRERGKLLLFEARQRFHNQISRPLAGADAINPSS